MPSCASADLSTVTYQVVHTTRYTYAESVLVAHHMARLSPRTLPYQECVSHVLEVDPEPAVQAMHASEEDSKDAPRRSEVASFFSAALELTRDRALELRQDQPFSDVYVRKARELKAAE